MTETPQTTREAQTERELRWITNRVGLILAVMVALFGVVRWLTL